MWRIVAKLASGEWGCMMDPFDPKHKLGYVTKAEAERVLDDVWPGRVRCDLFHGIQDLRVMSDDELK